MIGGSPAAPVQRTQAFGFGQIQQREAVGRPQALEGTLDAMTIGIGLHHGPDSGVGGLRACTAQVVREGVGVDEGFDGARHAGILRVPPGSAFRRLRVL